MITFEKTYYNEAVAYEAMKQLIKKLGEYEDVMVTAKGHRKNNIIHINITIKIN